MELLHCNCSWKEQNNSSQLTVFLWIRHNYPLLFVLIWPHYGRLDYLLVTNFKKTSALFKYLLNCYLYKFNSELLHLNVIKGIGFPFRTEATSFSLIFFGSVEREGENNANTGFYEKSCGMSEIVWGGWEKKSEKRRNKTSAYEFTALFFPVCRRFLMVVWVGMCLSGRNISLKWQNQCSMEACGKFYGFQLVVRFIISFSSICLYFFLRGGCGCAAVWGAQTELLSGLEQRRLNVRPLTPVPFSLLLLRTHTLVLTPQHTTHNHTTTPHHTTLSLIQTW